MLGIKIRPLRWGLRLLKAATPSVGREVRNVGLKLLTGAAVAGATSQALPDVPESWVQFAKIILQIIAAITGLIGTIMTVVGQSQAETPVDAE